MMWLDRLVLGYVSLVQSLNQRENNFKWDHSAFQRVHMIIWFFQFTKIPNFLKFLVWVVFRGSLQWLERIFKLISRMRTISDVYLSDATFFSQLIFGGNIHWTTLIIGLQREMPPYRLHHASGIISYPAI